MFLRNTANLTVRIDSLTCKEDGYYAVWRIVYFCSDRGEQFNEDPITCGACGSTNIRSSEVDLFPIG